MNINFELYKIFYTVAKHKNITKAANELMISQPAVSKSIKNLEEQLDGQLFIRSKNGVTLTNEGQEFFHYIEQAINLVNNAENKFTDLINLETGTIKIGISTTLTKSFLIKYLKEFHNIYPKIDIQIHTNSTDELITKLKNGLIDFVILNTPYKNNQDIEFKHLKEIHDYFIVGEKLYHLINKNLTLKDLSNYPLILQSPGSSARKFIDEFFSKHNINLTPSITLASHLLVTEFVKADFGIGFCTSEFIKQEIKDKNIFLLDITPKIPPRHITLAYSKNRLPSFCTRKLIELIENYDIEKE